MEYGLNYLDTLRKKFTLNPYLLSRQFQELQSCVLRICKYNTGFFFFAKIYSGNLLSTICFETQVAPESGESSKPIE